MISKIKDPVSALTHFIGAVLSVPITVFLIYFAVKNATAWHVASFIVFGVALVLLYTASTVYHSISISDRVSNILRCIDHMMIFVLIAGTYTPVCLVALRGPWGYTLFTLVWAIAIFGILLKIFWFNAPRKLSTLIYVVMGWLVIVAFFPLIRAIPPQGLTLLVLGGVAYTVGAVVYALKLPFLNFKFFGFHEIFHLFVIAGSTFHIIFMFSCIMVL